MHVNKADARSNKLLRLLRLLRLLKLLRCVVREMGQHTCIALAKVSSVQKPRYRMTPPAETLNN